MGKFTREDFQRAAPKFSKAFLSANPDLAAKMAPGARTGASCRPDLSKKLPTAPKPSLNGKFEDLWNAAGGPKLTPEYRFDPAGRRWRFDFCLPDRMIAIELEGTTYQGGRHQRKDGMDGDAEKYLRANLLGWVVIRLTRKLITPETVAALLAWDRMIRLP